MPGFDIVIRMTGLLLLSPTSQKSGFYYTPLQVLAPETSVSKDVPLHLSEVAFLSTRAECDSAAGEWRDRYCHVSLENSWLVIGDSAAPRILQEPSVRGNLSRFFDAALDTTLFSANPGGGNRIASRSTIYGGYQSDSCLAGRYNIHGVSVPLMNVVEWTTPVRDSTFKLRLFTRGSDGNVVSRELITLRSRRNTIYIRNDPKQIYETERDFYERRLTGVHPHVPKHSMVAQTVDHYLAFYRLLRIQGELPPVRASLSYERCPWDPAVNSYYPVSRNPATQTCMVGLALP